MKLHQKLFWLLILLLPIQLGRHFWFDWTQVLGLPIDYLSPTLYLTDILVVGILFFWWLENTSEVRILLKPFHNTSEVKRYWLFGVILIFLLVNSLLAVNRGAALYKLAKIIEFTLLGFYVAKNNYPPSAIRYPLSLTVAYSSLIAIVQFIKQSSLGGLFWWLGERTFSLMTPGIAKAIIGGRLVLRPYATFPHPNVLAGFMLVSLILLQNTSEVSQGVHHLGGGVRKILRAAAMVLGGIAIAISFSRATWLVGLVVGLIVISRHLGGGAKSKAISQHLRGGTLLLIGLVVVGFLFSFTQTLSGQEAFTQRLALTTVAIEMIKTNLLAGVGLNNFIPQLPYYWQQFGMTYWLQPVHNIFLLVAAEIGLTGLLILLWILALTYRRLLRTNNELLILLLSVILVLGLFDHYWLSLQQSQLLFTLILGLSWKR